MRFRYALLIGLCGAVWPLVQAAANPAEREARVRFNASLPPNCSRGWMGRGNGLVAVCELRGRYQARFIDGRVVVCDASLCADRAGEIDAFLRRRGF